MSPLGLLLLSFCDNEFRIDLKAISFLLSVIGISCEKAGIICNLLGLQVISWLN